MSKKFLLILCGFFKQFYNHLLFKWHEEQSVLQQYYNFTHWNRVSLMLQEDLFFVLKISPYEFLNNLFCSDNINNSGWEVRENETLYYFDIYTSESQNSFVLEQIRQKLNLKIAQYQQQFIQQYGHEQTKLSYPCIYYGMYILSIKQDGTMIRFEIISHLSHCTL